MNLAKVDNEPDLDVASFNGQPIPLFRIDLSLPPEERYVYVAKTMAHKLGHLKPIFDVTVGVYLPWKLGIRFVQFLAWIFLRRVFSAEQTAEIKSMSKHSGCPLYYLVALNVGLDALLGCTSGGVRTQPDARQEDDNMLGAHEDRMMHFRTLDWGMDSLRSILCQYEFVRSASMEPNRVIARAVGYAGFTGILTGIRQDLSVSLNFRPNRNGSLLSLGSHRLKLLLGFRPSICSQLRDMIIPDQLVMPQIHDSLQVAIDQLIQTPSVPCYVIMCDGTSTAVVERDLKSNEVRTSKEFIVHTNHDTDAIGATVPGQTEHSKSGILSMEGWLEESQDRMSSLNKRWNSLRRQHDKKQQEDGVRLGDQKPPVIKEELLRKWMTTYPIMNECTHHSMIMDPRTGDIRWLERGVVEAGKETSEESR